MQAGQAKIPPWLSFTWHHPLRGIWRTVSEDRLHSQASQWPSTQTSIMRQFSGAVLVKRETFGEVQKLPSPDHIRKF